MLTPLSLEMNRDKVSYPNVAVNKWHEEVVSLGSSFLRTFLENCRGRKNSGYHQKFKFKEIEGFLN